MRSQDTVSFISGRNGSGKTTVLRVIDALAKPDWAALEEIKFSKVSARLNGFDNQENITSTLNIEIDRTSEGNTLRAFDNESEITDAQVPSQQQNIAAILKVLEMQGVIWKATCGRHWASNINPHMTEKEVMDNHGQGIQVANEASKKLQPYLDKWNVSLYEVKRLYEAATTIRVNRSVQQAATLRSTVDNIPTKLQNIMERKDSEVMTSMQDREEQVLANLISFDQHNVPSVDVLNSQLAKINTARQNLNQIGLYANHPQIDVNLTNELSIELRHAVSDMLNELDRKLKPYSELLELIKIFEDMLQPTLRDIEIKIEKNYGLQFIASNGDHVQPCDLSSGQQQQLFLMFQIVFTGEHGQQFLIDEPEISMDYTWQTEIAERLERVAKVHRSKFILATHSPAVIAERWESANELN